MSKYNPNENYCHQACYSQSVKSAEEMQSLYPEWNVRYNNDSGNLDW